MEINLDPPYLTYCIWCLADENAGPYTDSKRHMSCKYNDQMPKMSPDSLVIENRKDFQEQADVCYH